MNDGFIVLGMDTSNYTTSIACSDKQQSILLDRRIPLEVKQGERGLRQSHALFQHLENLPSLLMEAWKEKDLVSRIAAIAVSSRPRPVEGSYMPVFKGGLQFGKVLATTMGVPLFTFSHQEGHLAAGAYGTSLNTQKPYLAYHLSGGTCELLVVDHGTVGIIGGTKDLSFGQVLDRIGVALGLSFPCGKALDEQAWQRSQAPSSHTEISIKPIPTDDLWINLSGLESQVQRILAPLSDEEKNMQLGQVAATILRHMGDSLITLTQRAVEQTQIKQVLFTGGVSASRVLRQQISQGMEGTDVAMFFGQPSLSSDNAVGIALLGGESIWR